MELGDCVEVLPQYLTRLGLFKPEVSTWCTHGKHMLCSINVLVAEVGG